jgi:hypothetical protein
MALLTAAQQLEEVQTAISALLAGGQQVELDGQRVTMANLEALTARENILIQRKAREDRGTRGVSLSVGVQRR